KFAGAADETEKVKAVVESAVVKTFGEWLDELIKAAEGGGKAAAAAGDVNKAAAAVGAVSGEQILNAIVTAAGKDGQDGKAAGDAKNAIEAAIGGAAAAEFGTDNDKIGKKNDQIAAALVLRGVAKDGKFAGAADETEKVKAVVESAVVKTFGEWLDELIKAAEGGGKAADGGGDKIGNVDAAGGGAKADATSVNGIAGAIKGIVEAAKKVEGVKFAPTKAADAGGGDGNKKAGKLFGTNAGAHAEDVNKAAAAVGAVSGEQILNAIVTAAGQAGKDGKAAGQATNAIEAAIGGDAAADFGNDIKKKNDQIAAALVLRGVAKSGKFAGAANNAKEVKAVVESAVVKTVGEWLDGLIKAAEGGGKAADGGGGDKIGNVDAAGGGAKADKESVNGIAGAIKGIVEAAKKVEGVKFEPTAAADADNKKAGKLFGTNAAAAAEDVKDAAAAVGAVSGEQILNAIVTAAGKDGQDGKKADDATNAIEAAIGGAGGAADFGNDIKKKNDQIALTSFIVLPLIYIIFI
uniref:variable large family protein n=2 Tax=Borreliella TaxID=64895 RepID=UPI001E2DECD7